MAGERVDGVTNKHCNFPQITLKSDPSNRALIGWFEHAVQFALENQSQFAMGLETILSELTHA
jgi:hypothetical protein